MFKFYIALLCAKSTYLIMKLLKRRASQFPGYIAMKICPNYLELIKTPNKVICVTGTDGKTTVANLITDMLTVSNYKTISNKVGSNTHIGVASVLTNSVNIFGKTKFEAAVLEIDEHWIRKVCPQIKPNYLLVTNIIRDSLKRNAHPEYVFNKLNMCDVPNMKVILNADELLSSQLFSKGEKVFFGIDKLKTDLKKSPNIINDFKFCPKCHTEMIFNYVRFCHIGNAYCPNCHFRSKEADYKVTKIDLKNEIIKVAYKEESYTFPLINDGIFNIYNEIAIIALFFEMNFTEQQINHALENVAIAKTRFTEQIVNNTKIVKLMAKGNNAIPVSIVFDYIRKKEGNKIVVLALDDYDEKKASEFVCWIYDTDYEFLKDEKIKQFIVSGPRCYDHKVRLLIAGIDKKKIICKKDELQALEKINSKNIDYIYILHDMSSYDLSVAAENKVIEILKGESK